MKKFLVKNIEIENFLVAINQESIEHQSSQAKIEHQSSQANSNKKF